LKSSIAAKASSSLLLTQTLFPLSSILREQSQPKDAATYCNTLTNLLFTEMAAPQQADGSYPRLNATKVKTGKYNGMIVSLVGRFISMESFQCSDGGTITLSNEHADIPAYDSNVIVEIVGQVSSPELVAVRMQLYGVPFVLGDMNIHENPYVFAVG
jgi:hypothetical protein